MAYDRFLIAPFNTGLQTNLKPWLILDDAFEELQNMYVFRGRVRKRFGSLFMGSNQLSSRLRLNLAVTDVNGDANGITPSATGSQGQMFSIGGVIFTANATGALLVANGSATIKTFNFATGAFAFTNVRDAAGVLVPLNTPVYWYPALPVMGITQFLQGAVNNHPTYAFDTRYAYAFVSPTGWERSGTAVWKGNNLNYFWAANWIRIDGNLTLYVTNFNFTLGAGAPAATDDPIWYMNKVVNAPPSADSWVPMLGSTANGIFFLPNGGAVAAGPFVQTALIIVQFHNRLVLLNTIENNNTSTTGTGTATQYKNRARWCFYGDPTAVNAWYEPKQQDAAGNVGAGGNFADAATDEEIISAAFFRDRLIVYFERSTWELAYTGNQVKPFEWQKLNAELGSQSTFSSVTRDQEITTIGQTGVHSCNGVQVARIDQRIPDEIFQFQTQDNQTKRTAGIIDYTNEMIYWAFVSTKVDDTHQHFANQILAYNYRNNSWAHFDDCFTTFGYFEQQTDTTWASSAPQIWSTSSETWQSGVIQANDRQIIGGTPEGFVLRVVPNEISRNAPSMQITNVSIAVTGIVTFTVINHNLSMSNTAFGFPDYVMFENFDATLNPIMATFFAANPIWPVNSISGFDIFTINTNGGLVGPETYVGGATLARVSNTQILSKQYNPYDKDGMDIYLAKIDFGVSKTDSGEITVDYYPSATPISMIQGGVASNSIMGNNVLETFPYSPTYYPLEQYQQRLWHPIYFQSYGETIQLAMYMTRDQMMDADISQEDLEIQGMILYTQRSGRLQ